MRFYVTIRGPKQEFLNSGRALYWRGYGNRYKYIKLLLYSHGHVLMRICHLQMQNGFAEVNFSLGGGAVDPPPLKTCFLIARLFDYIKIYFTN